MCAVRLCGRFAPLLNADVLLDLLDYLRRLIDPTAATPLPVDVLLCCLSTLLRLTRVGHGSAVSVDLLSCARHLYAAMWLCVDVGGAQHLPLLLDCVDELCLQSRAMPPARVSALLHRLAVLAATVPQPALALATLHCCHQLLLAYPACRTLLDEPAVAGGRFDADMDDCDACNAHTQPLLQLSSLMWSSDPNIVQAARTVALHPAASTVLPAHMGAGSSSGSRRPSCGQVARQLQQYQHTSTFALPPPAALVARRANRKSQSNAASKAKRVALHAILPQTDFLHNLQSDGK